MKIFIKRAPMLSHRDFEFLKIIGSGTSGQVFLARQISNGKYCAIKRLDKIELKRYRQLDNICNELSIMREVSFCPFIVRFLHAIESEKYVFIVMEYVNGGELFYYLKKYTRFSENTVLFYTAEIVLALKHLHDRDIIYRDLKPENVLVTNDGHIKLADFGFATRLSDSLLTVCGTPEYMAPEKLQGLGDGKITDYWALGCIIYEMFCSEPPFYDVETNLIYRKILNDRVKIPKDLPPTAKHLISHLLEKERENRLGFNGIEEIMNHPFFMGIDWDSVSKLELKPPLQPSFDHFENPNDRNYINMKYAVKKNLQHSYRRRFRSNFK